MRTIGFRRTGATSSSFATSLGASISSTVGRIGLVGGEVGAKIGAEVGAEVGSEIGGETGAEVGAEIGGETGAEVGAEVTAMPPLLQHSKKMPSSVGQQFPFNATHFSDAAQPTTASVLLTLLVGLPGASGLAEEGSYPGLSKSMVVLNADE